MSDLISRQAAIEHFCNKECGMNPSECEMYPCYQIESIQELPSTESEIVRCKDCRWWDKYGDYDNGYCMAAKHGYWSEHWEISIRRTYKGDFYCADAEMRGEQDEID